ncbi:synaptonemal complex protein 2-like isoform X2 [Triplophysa dalaica]|uniref:synaptonemal complex protein 2-like isoform X2 n=1 Tax=Triplophysa dalaica TaxID=1582913 RepID=UPI0024DF719C|nr:synaptonemal complex protein 2-like isoform X2 [Triplophysa dalaica]
MAPLKDRQVEKLLDEALKHNNFQALENFLQDESKLDSSFQCSRHFITKLDKLVVRELDIGHVFNVCLVLTILHKWSATLVFPGGGGISVMISQGLIRKMVQWFERARKLWAEAGSARNELLIKLAEDFFDALMVVHESCKEGTFEVTESLLSLIGKVASDPKINVMIQKEAARKLNLILAKIPMELKKKILMSREASTMMSDVASRVLQGGDYDLQVSLMEALCRMTSTAQRNELAERWFTMTFVSSAFKKIKESEFETDCRRFLNMVNGMLGDGKSVYSYPCLEAFLNKHELLMPVDENLEAFWIDFNLGSQSISFYFSVSDKDVQDGQWDTLCISEIEVHSYTVEEENGRKVLNLSLTDPVSIGSLEGSRVTIKFSSSLNILQATEKVYGPAKNRKSVKKPPSVVKTPVQVSLCSQESSQVLVLESQVSDERESSSVKHGYLGQPNTHLTPDKNKIVTPMKVSESCMYITGSVGHKQGSCSSSCVLPAVSLAKLKPALQMMSSSERKREFQLRDLMLSRTSSSISSLNIHCETNQRQTHSIQARSAPAVQNVDKQKSNKGKSKAEKHQKITVDKVLEMKQADQQHEREIMDSNIVPDTQPAVRKRKFSVSGPLFALPKDCSGSRSISNGDSLPPPQRLSPAQRAFRTLTQKQLHTQLTQRLEEVLRDQGPDVHTTTDRKASSLDPCATGQGKENAKSSMRSTPARPAQQSRRVQDKALYSDKENKRPTADSMVKMISSHYKKTSKAVSPVASAQLNIAPTNRYLFNKSWCPSSTEKTAARSLKILGQSKKPNQDIDDVYAFKEDTSNINVKKTRKPSETSRMDSSTLSYSPACTKSVSRPQPPKALTKNMKKNLFSDTDTDNMTEVSWLNSANRKPKPKVADYSRQPVKPTVPQANSSFKSPYTPLSSPKPMGKQIRPKQKRHRKVVERQEDKLQGRIGNGKPSARPHRAAAQTKTYKEQSDSDHQSSQSESEKPPPPKKKALGLTAKLPQTVPAQTTGRGQRTKEHSKISEKKGNDSSRKDHSPGHRIVKKTPSAQGHKHSWMARLSSTFASPPSIERMRSDEKLTTKMRSNTTPLRSLSISPIEPDSPPPASLSPVRDVQASLCKTLGIKGAVKPPSVSTTTPVSTSTRGSKQKPPAPLVELSPVHSLLSPTGPPITPTGKEKSTLSSSLISADLQEEQRGVVNRTSPASFDRSSIISVTMSQSSHISVSNTALIRTDLEKTPACLKRFMDKMPEFKSGPSVIYKPPSSCHSASLSKREEDSEEDKENRPPSPSQLAMKMKQRKLFKSNDKCVKVKQPVNSKRSSEEEEVEETVADNGRRKKSYPRGQNKRARETTTSTEDVETVSSYMKSRCVQSVVEEDSELTQPAQEVGFICHQFSSELKRKIKHRSRRMDLYTRQSLKTFQQHMFSVRVQVHQYSSQKLEKVKQVLLGEIKNLEQDDISLRNMEEELMTYWKKQASAFHTYQEKATKRQQHLKNTIQTDVCDGLQYEDEIFSSEMYSMKKNLKAVQERFFNEMQEEELLNVRRGLQTLFLQDASRF